MKIKFLLELLIIHSIKLLLKKKRMDQDSNDFLENVKDSAFVIHLEVESLKNSAQLGRHMSETGKLSLNTFSN